MFYNDNMHKPSQNDFWRDKTIEELAREQNLEHQPPIEQLIGQGKDLWESDDELDKFLNGIQERRHEPSTT